MPDFMKISSRFQRREGVSRMSANALMADARHLRYDRPVHACHAQIARRANLSQSVGIAVTPKSAADFAASRLDNRGVRVVTDVGREAVDAGGSVRRTMPTRTAKACGPDTPTLVSSS
jgi:hypothetical protein